MTSLQLKALEIQGFKSFPEKTVLTFPARITAIVGPNGSGKSNISDAIRWVMGEQSTKALRGGKMEDVIFGGTQTRRSHGFAQVSLIMDNEDGSLPMDDNEIVVTRRYYRSGDSEYYINRHQVRLRDIHELFMDTGLGQEGYALIGQGRIDEILSQKSTQRREVFEEAAGISRFRHRKEESERKLQRTRDNLLRIGDKIEELELQIEPLREQAEKAKTYFRCQEEVRVLEISFWMDRLDRLRSSHQETRDNYETMQRQLEEIRAETERLYAVSESLTLSMQEKEQEIEVARGRLGGLEEDSARCETQLSVLQVRIANNEENIEKYRQEAQVQLDRGDGVEAQAKAREERLSSLLSQREELLSGIAQCSEQQEQLQRQMEETARSLSRLDETARLEEQSARQVQNLLLALDASGQEVEQRESGLLETLDQLDGQLKTIGAQIAQKDEALTALRQEFSQSREGLSSLKDTLAAAQAAQGEQEEQAVNLRMESNNVSSRVRMLSEMEKLYEGYSKAVKVVMGEVKQGGIHGVHGPIAELFSVPSDYTIAIEIALGGAMQNLVVDTENDGKNVISYLKRKEAGRATCLPLSAMRPSRLEEQGLSQVDGYAGIAAELISYDAKYQNVMANLLGRVVIAENLDKAIVMARQYRYRFRIVTLDGQVLSPGGSMTGGSVNRKGGILSRAKELEELTLRQGSLEQSRQQAEARLEEAKADTTKALQALETAQETLRQLESKGQLVQSEKSALKLQEEGLLAQRTRSSQELEQLRARTEQSKLDAAKAKESVSDMERLAQSRGEERAEIQGQYDSLQRAREDLSAEISTLRETLVAVEAEQRVSQQSLEELAALQENLKQDHQRRQAEAVSLAQETRVLQNQEAEERQRQEALSLQRQEAQEALSSLNLEKLQIEGRRTQADRDGRNQNETLLSSQQKTAQLEQQILSAQQEEETLLGKLWESYELSHEAALEICQPIEDRAKSERRISALKSEIRSLGNVNLGAMEEFDRVSERYDYLHAQRTDVEESDRQLVGIIDSITAEMEVIFRREFKRINEAFSETFVQLFQGGNANLSLDDEDDILNCGIEIQVQPPGKNVKHLNLLSGGEKAFVAIALYFGILKVHPTPFCILDEIEAALDDANVIRFARYLRSISDATQMIVITHRRGTMEEADILYGITMEEQGVSRILRMDLNEAERTLNKR